MNPRSQAASDPAPRAVTVLLVGTEPADPAANPADPAGSADPTAEVLRAQGYTVLTAANPGEARHLFDAHAPDLVAIDATGTESAGFATCAELRAAAGCAHRPLLLLTAPGDDAAVLRAYAQGASDVFVGTRQGPLLAGRLRALLQASHTQGELVHSQAQLARVQDLARMGSFVWRRVDGSLRLAPEGLRVLGWADGEHPGLRTLLRRMPREERALSIRLLHELARENAAIAADLPLQRPDGRWLIVHVEGLPEIDAAGQRLGYTGFLQDVTDRRAAEDKIRHLANFDALTGLPNRRQAIWRAERALAHAQRLQHGMALLAIDLDRFQRIADTLGPAAGDALLVEVARRLRACLRHHEQVREPVGEPAPCTGGGSRLHRTLEAVGRLGGDEFLVLLPELAADADADRIAARILAALREPIHIGAQECVVTASIGVAVYPRDGDTVAELLRNANVALYSVKAAGRNGSAHYAPRLPGGGQQQLALESALRYAIERQELRLHYQPKLDVPHARLVGVEALLRWQRGDLQIAPAAFIPLAEDSGLIVPLSEWVLREAARQSAVWRERHGFDWPIAINLPSRVLAHPDLIERLHRVVSAEGVPLSAIQIEITETTLMGDLQRVIPLLNRLNQIGVEISVDDFGTGYSSLAYLTTLPISELKIDRSFVRDLGQTPQSAAVVTAIVALARALGLRVTAEGVESMRQMAVLRGLGCHTMQGFLFSAALPPDELVRWVLEGLLPRRLPWIDSDGESYAANI
jgi:predicted signal transduction protein with EAL and GGDEF domain